MKRLAALLWAPLVSGAVLVLVPQLRWLWWPGITAASLLFPGDLKRVDSGIPLIAIGVFIIGTSSLVWGAVIYSLARVAFWRCCAERA